MKQFSEVVTQMTNLSEHKPVRIPQTHTEFLQWQCDTYNASQGDLQGYDCPECLNRGYFELIRDDTSFMRECRCMKIRRNLERLKKAGFIGQSERFTFENYRASSEWQKKAKATAERYVNENPDKWLFFGGQSGCGKTHLCTAVCMELIRQEHDVKYVQWRDIVHYLEANRFKEEKYSSKITELKDIEILYIDDFLKTTHKIREKPAPSETEMNIAYEIINARVVSGNKTIISSEMHVRDISCLDEATGGRISENSEGFQIQINYQENRNYRFFGKD